jgi:hypothetical protein
MKFKNNKVAIFLSLLALSAVSIGVNARPNINSAPGSGKKGGSQAKTTASTCKPAEANIDLDINNVRARLMTGGDMWWDIGTEVAQYEVPKGTKKNSLFAGSVWIGGYDAQRQLKVAAQTYRQDGNDYWPGPLDAAANITASDCSEWDRFWKVNKETVNKFRDLKDKSAAVGTSDYETILQWPAKGNDGAVGSHNNNLNIATDKDYAPFIDVDNNGIYNPVEGGDYPDIRGDQFIWWVYNDKGNVKQQSQTEGIGIEVQASAFAYAAKDFLNDATFYNYRLINRGNLKLDSTFIATWTDADLGYYKDDYIGCDVSRGLGILYNGKSQDGNGEVNSYGTQIPMVGIDFFKGPQKTYRPVGATKDTTITLSMEAFTYFNNDASPIGNPSNGIQIYNYMTGAIKNGERFSNDFVGVGVPSKGYGSGPVSKFVFTGDPGVPTEWSECTCNNPPDDRRFVHSSGPFTLMPGVVNDITIGAVWVADVGGCPTTSFKKIRVADDGAQGLFDRNFQTIEGPEAPRMTVREMDRKLIFYIVNDSSSTNFQEKFGRDTAKKYRVVSSKAHKTVNDPDSVYKFEGYRVFQVKDATVTPADIFSSETGEINKDKAAEVFQCDVKNGVTKIVNWSKRVDISANTFVPQLKVSGKDSGIKHSFVLSTDQFAKGADKKFVNYRNYYFVAIAYAYNNFATFNPDHTDSTQDVPYLESQHGPNSSAIPVVVAMPNPANGNMGTVLNSDYGDGVKIQRLEGIGNGGNDIQMTDESEAEALQNGQSLQPFYKISHAPVDIKIIDPVKIQPAEWMLYITGPLNTDPAKGLVDSTSQWRLVNNTTGDVIYSESDRGLKIPNEQIIEKYGLSVNIAQVKRPQDDQSADNTGISGKGGNGLIDSRVIFEDPAKAWLSGVKDGEQQDRRNWIRSGRVQSITDTICNFNDLPYDTIGQFYENLMSNYSFTKGTWAPYALGSFEQRGGCGFGTVRSTSGNAGLYNIHSVDIVFTSDKSKWSRCAVLEMQEDKDLSEGNTIKYDLRNHASWNLDIDEQGRPVYATDPTDKGMSWFPGYAIDQETGERLNVIFGEDSYLRMHNGADMIWNPTSVDIQTIQATNTELGIYGGKHVIYVLPSKYDQCESFIKAYNGAVKINAYKFMYTGFPLLNQYYQFLPLSQGLIPTTTRVQIRVNRPYNTYVTSTTPQNDNFPLYRFNTADQAATPLSANSNMDKQALLDRIHAVPNPYYGYVGYEINRLDTRVRIINLPQKATVSIYSLDGTLINRLSKDNPNVSYIDWNVRNLKELPVASGMYLIHVNAEGIGETVIRWFGAMRPLDVTTN